MTTTASTVTITDIESLTKCYAEHRAALSERVGRLEAALADCKRQHLAGIKTAVGRAAQAEGALRAALTASPALFVRPRSLILHGIRVGWQKQKGTLEWDDDAQVVTLIKRHCPEDADALIVTTQKPCKSALAELEVAELKRLAVRVTGTGDAVLIKPTDTEVDRLVERLLAEARDAEPEAA